MPTEDAWLAEIGSDKAVTADNYAGEAKPAIWLASERIAQAWMQYVKDTEVADTTPPPAPTNLRITGKELTWNAQADLESGLAGFIIERNGETVARLPQQGKNPFGRPIFQNLQYSDTPTQPLVSMKFVDADADLSKPRTYRVFSLNTRELKSEPASIDAR